MDVTLVVDLPESWLREFSEADSAHVRIVDVKSDPRRGIIQHLVHIISTNEGVEELETRLRGSQYIKKLDVVNVDQHQLVGSVTAERCVVCDTFAGLNTFVVGGDVVEGGKSKWELLVSGDDALQKLFSRLERAGVAYKLVKKVALSGKPQLTARQDEVLRIALMMGYFDFPKRIRLEELASRLGVTAGTLSEILRRAEKAALTKYFESKNLL